MSMFRIHYQLLQTSKQHSRYYHGSVSSTINSSITHRLFIKDDATTINANGTSWLNLTQQKRYFGRRGGASAFKVRPPTAKQRKRYNRRQKQLHFEKVGKHSAPGSKAGPKREMERMERQHLLDLHYSNDKLESGKSSNIGIGGGKEEGLLASVNKNDEYTGMDAMLDDLVGNTSYLSSKESPTRERIGYIYRHQLDEVQTQIQQNDNLSDNDIALLIRSYRDTKTYKRRPIGIKNVLTHLKEVGIPIKCLNTFSYNALLSCAANSVEGLHLIDDMKRNGIPRCSYTYAILVDLYANRGDFRTCSNILHTTMAEEGIEPSLAAYTSLLKACHKIVNRGAVSSSLKHEAIDVAWQAWKHMRINNIKADVMAYGAIINVYAAGGQAEKCLDFLNEMPMFEVDPTTFVFTAALRGVARSHANVLRFEGGYSRLNRRREITIRHHGKMTREITIMAENAEVKLDDGFFAALMSCSAVAGDFATTKAIYLSHLVRKNCQFLRNIGDDDHLRRIRGMQKIRQMELVNGNNMNALENPLEDTTTTSLLPANAISSNEIGSSSNGIGSSSNLIPSTTAAVFDDESSSNALTKQQEQTLLEEEIEAEKKIEEYHEEQTLREHGPDTRLLTSLLHSYSNAMLNPGLGYVWNGIIHEQPDDVNQGYLDERTLDKIVKYPETIPESDLPKDIPEEEMAFSSKTWNDPEDDAIPGRSLKLKKFQLKHAHHGTTEQDYVEMNYEQKAYEEEQEEKEKKGALEQQELLKLDEAEQKFFPKDNDDTIVGTFYDSKKGETQIKSIEQTKYKSIDKYDTEEEFFEDQLQLQQFEKSKTNSNKIPRESSTSSDEDDEKTLNERYLQEFEEEDDITQHFDRTEEIKLKEQFDNTEKEIDDKFHKLSQKVGIINTDDMSDDQMSDLISSMQDEFGFDDDEFGSIKEEMLLNDDEDEESEHFDSALHSIDGEDEEKYGEDDSDNEEDSLVENVKQNSYSEHTATSKSENYFASSTIEDTIDKQTYDENNDKFSQNGIIDTEIIDDDDSAFSIAPISDQSSTNKDINATIIPFDEEEHKLQKLSNVLPGLPRERLSDIIHIYSENMSDPSIISLVPVLRETLPKNIDTKYLRDAAYDNALVTMKAAQDDGLIDGHVLNGMLQVVCNSRSVQDILQYYDDMERKYDLKPTPYDDRLVMDALLKKKYFNKALDFKRKVVEQQYNRTLDLISYTNLVGYCSNRGQVGSALLLIKECKRIHGFPPNEKGVKYLRRHCNHKGIDIGLDDLVGPDPSAWRRRGEAELKREYSYRGRRDVIRVRNAATSL